MILEEYGRYKTVTQKQVILKHILPHENIDLWLRQRLFVLLQTPAEYEALEQALQDNHIIVWLTDDLNMPSGFRHQETGKCLGWNTPAFGDASGAFVQQYLAQFDIK